MKRTILFTTLAATSLAITALWLASYWSTFQTSKGSLVSLPCTEIMCRQGTMWIARLSSTRPVSRPTDSDRDYRLVRWQSISGPAATVRIGGVKITGGRGMYAGFNMLNPPLPVAMQNVRFTWIIVNVWPFIPLFAAYPIIAVILIPHRRRAFRRLNGLCLYCGYNLTGNLSGICPECGEKA